LHDARAYLVSSLAAVDEMIRQRIAAGARVAVLPPDVLVKIWWNLPNNQQRQMHGVCKRWQHVLSRNVKVLFPEPTWNKWFFLLSREFQVAPGDYVDLMFTSNVQVMFKTLMSRQLSLEASQPVERPEILSHFFRILIYYVNDQEKGPAKFVKADSGFVGEKKSLTVVYGMYDQISHDALEALYELMGERVTADDAGLTLITSKISYQLIISKPLALGCLDSFILDAPKSLEDWPVDAIQFFWAGGKVLEWTLPLVTRE
jgi:hypothetical protein